MNSATPTASTPVMTSRRRWPRKLAVWACVGLAVLMALHLTWYLLAESWLRTARAEAQAAGLSLSIEAVVPEPCADADNAALLYQRAFGLLTLGASPYVPLRDQGRIDSRLRDLLDERTDFIGRTHRDEAWQDFTPDQRAAALALLDGEEFARVWQLVGEGARLPRCRFAYAYDQGPHMLLPEVTLFRSLVRLGLVRALLLADAGRRQEASDQLADLLWMRRQLLEEPILISNISGDALETQILATLRELVAAGALDTIDLSRCREALLTDADRSAAIVRCINAEVVLMGVWIFNYLEDPLQTMSLQSELGQATSPLGAVAMRLYASWLGRPLRAADEAAYLRVMTGIYQNPGKAEVSDPPLSFLHPITGLMLPASGNLTKSQRRNGRLADTARMALAIAAGEVPDPIPGVAVTETAEGETLVTPELADTSDASKKALLPWRVKR